MSAPSLALRDATPSDIPMILQLVRELADYERDPDAAVAKPELMHAALFGDRSVATAVLAEENGETLGFALYFFNFSTWTGRPGLYLEDLFVRPHARGRGVGVRLFTHLAAVAQARGCGRFELAVLDWNEPAIRFYERMGGKPMSDWTVFRFDESAIADLARRAGAGS